MRIISIILLAALFLASLSLIPHPAALAQDKEEAKAEPEEKEPNKLVIACRKKVVRLHEKAADALEDVGRDGDAILEYELILYHDPDHKDARKALGFEKNKLGAWIFDRDWEAPTNDSGDEKQKDLDKAQAKFAKYREEIVEELLEACEELEKDGETSEAALLFSDAAWYAPDDKEIAELRGWQKIDGAWHPSYYADEKSEALELLDAAIKRVDEKCKPAAYTMEAGDTQIEFQKVALGDAIYSAIEGVRAKRQLAVALASLDLMTKVLSKEPLEDYAYAGYEFSKQANFHAAIDATDAEDKKKAFAKDLTFWWAQSDTLYLSRASVQFSLNADAILDDANCGCAANWHIRYNRDGYNPDAWLYIGNFAYTTSRVVGSTRSNLYAVLDKVARDRTAAEERRNRYEGMIPNLDKGDLTIESMRALERNRVRLDDQIDLLELANMNVNEIRAHEASLAYGTYEFLMNAHREKFVAWLLTVQEKNQDGKERLRLLLESLELEYHELIAEYRDWVKLHF